MNEKLLNEKILKITKRSEQYQYSNSVIFTEEADNYGFSWTPSLSTLQSSCNRENMTSTEYLKVLQSDPVFHNPGSHELMLECYGIEPYFSFKYGMPPMESWNYRDLQKQRNQQISTQLTIDGIDLCRKGRYEDALRSLKQAIDISATNVDALVAIGACHANIGNLKEAILHLETALSLNPNDKNALLYLEKTKFQLARRNSVPVLPQESEQSSLNASTVTETISNDTVTEGNTRSKDQHRKRTQSDDESCEKNHKKKRKKHKKKKRKSRKSHESSSSSSTPTRISTVEEAVHPILTRAKNSFWG